MYKKPFGYLSLRWQFFGGVKARIFFQFTSFSPHNVYVYAYVEKKSLTETCILNGSCFTFIYMQIVRILFGL